MIIGHRLVVPGILSIVIMASRELNPGKNVQLGIPIIDKIPTAEAAHDMKVWILRQFHVHFHNQMKIKVFLKDTNYQTRFSNCLADTEVEVWLNFSTVQHYCLIPIRLWCNIFAWLENGTIFARLMSLHSTFLSILLVYNEYFPWLSCICVKLVFKWSPDFRFSSRRAPGKKFAFKTKQKRNFWNYSQQNLVDPDYRKIIIRTRALYFTFLKFGALFGRMPNRRTYKIYSVARTTLHWWQHCKWRPCT